MTALTIEIHTRADAERAINTLQQTGCGYRIPLVQAALDGRVAHLEIQRSGCSGKAKRFIARTANRPTLILVGDDDGDDTGPNGWPLAQRLMRWSAVIVLHATGGQRWHYESALDAAVSSGTVLLVECGTATLPAWKEAARRWAPAAFVVALVPNGQGVHPVNVLQKVMQ